MMTNIPLGILAGIREAAANDWPQDAEMQQHFTDTETEAYSALLEFEFGEAGQIRDAIMEESTRYSETWQDRLWFARDEVTAFKTLAALMPEDVSPDFVIEMKRKAADQGDYYSVQLDEVRQGIERHRIARRVHAEIEPIRELLVRMESIIGSECYNANIQNYGSGGIWLGEGRSFRYPITFIREGSEVTRRSDFKDLKAEELVTGYYKFGANGLSIHRALVRIVQMLQADFGLKLSKD